MVLLLAFYEVIFQNACAFSAHYDYFQGYVLSFHQSNNWVYMELFYFIEPRFCLFDYFLVFFLFSQLLLHRLCECVHFKFLKVLKIEL